jgi:hypothetical protein
MKPELISACQMFLVPSTIMFAALGITEGLKTLVRRGEPVQFQSWVRI